MIIILHYYCAKREIRSNSFTRNGNKDRTEESLALALRINSQFADRQEAAGIVATFIMTMATTPNCISNLLVPSACVFMKSV